MRFHAYVSNPIGRECNLTEPSLVVDKGRSDLESELEIQASNVFSIFIILQTQT